MWDILQKENRDSFINGVLGALEVSYFYGDRGGEGVITMGGDLRVGTVKVIYHMSLLMDTMWHINTLISKNMRTEDKYEKLLLNFSQV